MKTNFKALKYITIALIIKSIILFYLIQQSYGTAYESKFITPIVLKSNDFGYFLQPVENYFSSGKLFYLDIEHPYAGRMPGYWFPYLLLRFCFEKNVALSILISIQITLSAISVYLLAKTAELITASKKYFTYTFWIYLICPYTISFDLQTQSESLAISCAVFFIYFLAKYQFNGQGKRHLFVSGLFMTWLIFLRPFMGILLLLVPLFLGIANHRKKVALKNTFGIILIFVSSFTIIESAWVVRNYLLFKKFIPLESSLTESYGKVYSKSWVKIRRMIKSFGENPAYFEPGTMAEWYKESNKKGVNENYNFNPKIFNGVKFNEDSLILLRQNYIGFTNTKIDSIESKYETLCTSAAERYRKDFIANNRISFYLLFPIKRTLKFLFNSGSSYLLLPPFSAMKFHQKLIKLCASFMYYIILSSFLLYTFLALKNRKVQCINLLLFATIYSLILFVSIYADIQENRYLMPIFPFILLLSIQSLEHFKLKQNRANEIK